MYLAEVTVRVQALLVVERGRAVDPEDASARPGRSARRTPPRSARSARGRPGRHPSVRRPCYSLPCCRRSPAAGSIDSAGARPLKGGRSGSTPQSSQTPSTPEATKPNTETTFRPRMCGPVFAKIPIRLEPISPPVDDERDHEPVREHVELVHELVEPLVDEADLDLARRAPARACRGPGTAARPPSARAATPSRRARPSTRRGVKRSTISERAYGLRDLEDVEVRVEVDPDRADRRDRLVEQHEARRQPQVHRVDQREGLADQLERVDLAAGSSRSSASRSRAARRRTAPRCPSGSARRGRRAACGSASMFSLAASMNSARQLREVALGQLAGRARSRRARSGRARARGCSPGAGRRGRTRAGRSSSSRSRRSRRRGGVRCSSVQASSSRSASWTPSRYSSVSTRSRV